MSALVFGGCEEEKFRDGKRAIELATRACELSNWNDAISQIVLAIAHAETGDFQKALILLDAAEVIANDVDTGLVKMLRPKFEQKEKHRESREPPLSLIHI